MIRTLTTRSNGIKLAAWTFPGPSQVVSPHDILAFFTVKYTTHSVNLSGASRSTWWACTVMVGVPRSKGCVLCVKRRIKCDQNRPGRFPKLHPESTSRPLTTGTVACANCIKYGAGCPGYEKDHKFVTGKHVVRSRGQNQQRSHETLLDFSPAPATSSTFFTKENASSSGVLTWQSSSQATGDTNSHAIRNTPDIPGSLREPALHFVYNMMGELFVNNPRQDVIYSAPWFSSLLDHLGRSPALDTALCAFMLRLVGTSKNDEGEISRSRALYGQTLRSLQRALDHPVAWKSTETLAATMICCQIEVGVFGLGCDLRALNCIADSDFGHQLFAGTLSPLSWMVHAVGVSKLIQHRGYRCFSTRVDKALLRGFRPLIVRIS